MGCCSNRGIEEVERAILKGEDFLGFSKVETKFLIV
jgi:hypothetical protein